MRCGDYHLSAPSIPSHRPTLEAMHVTALQLPARHGAAKEQLAFTEALLESGPRTDLVLLPEASLTGYVSADGDFDLTAFAEPIEGPTRAALAGNFASSAAIWWPAASKNVAAVLMTKVRLPSLHR